MRDSGLRDLDKAGWIKYKGLWLKIILVLIGIINNEFRATSPSKVNKTAFFVKIFVKTSKAPPGGTRGPILMGDSSFFSS